MADIITSVVTGGTNSHATVSEEINAVATDFIVEGVVGAITNTGGVSPATGSFAINQSGTPAMTVDVSAGAAYITGTPSGQSSQTLRARMASATTAYAISANTSGSTKYDWIYLELDAVTAADPSASADDVVSIYTSRSTSNVSDTGTPPTYGILLAVVTVANAASSIVNANIADSREVITLAVELPDDSVETTDVIDKNITHEKLKSTVMFRGTTTQTVTNSVSPTSITTYTEVTDRGADFNHTTGLFTAPYDGDYWFGANVGFENVVIPRMGLRIFANSVIIAEEFGSSTTNTYDPRMSCSAAVAMTAGQTAYISVYQDSGGDIALHSTSSFSGYLIGRV